MTLVTVLLAISTAAAPGNAAPVSLKSHKVPSNVFAAQGDAFAVRVSGKKSEARERFAIPLPRVDHGSVSVIELSRGASTTIPHELDGKNAMAEISAGTTYVVLNASPQWQPIYDYLCRVRTTSVNLAPKVCGQILCPMPEIPAAPLPPGLEPPTIPPTMLGFASVCTLCDRLREPDVIIPSVECLPPASIPNPPAMAFVSRRDGSEHIYTMGADGSGQTKLAAGFWPRWAPNGRDLAFVRDGDIWVTSTTSASTAKRVTDGVANNTKPAWTPDGRSIVFLSNRTGTYKAYKVTRIPFLNRWSSPSSYACGNSNYAFAFASPPASRVVATYYPAGVNQGTTDVVDLTTCTNLTNTPAVGESDPSWHPGGRIAFTSWPSGQSDVFTMASDGSQRTNLTNGTRGWCAKPIWSPDGTRIAFAADPGNNWDVWTMTGTGANMENLTNRPARDGAGVIESYLTWSPDSRQVAFTSDEAGNVDIYAVDVVTKQMTRLTTSPAWDYFPQWNPRQFAVPRAGLVQVSTLERR